MPDLGLVDKEERNEQEEARLLRHFKAAPKKEETEDERIEKLQAQIAKEEEEKRSDGM